MLYLELDINDFPVLQNIEKDKLNTYLEQIFRTGYNIHFPKYCPPEYNHIISKIDQLGEEIKDTNIKDYLLSLDTSLNKLIGLSSNSNKKGNFAENVLENIFEIRYGDIKFERKSGVAHSGDAWLYLPDNTIIILESKNYNTTVNKDEIEKLHNDMIEHNIKWGLFVSFNSQIQGYRELDIDTFIHNNETYSIIFISNLSNNMSKLDLGIQIIRKLIVHSDIISSKNPLIINNINESLIELNNISKHNYLLRDQYYKMEENIHKSLSSYHTILRDYQYELETKIQSIIKKLYTIDTIDTNNYELILKSFHEKKTFDIITVLLDIITSKLWILTIKDINNWIVMHKDTLICTVTIQLKKVIIVHNQIELTFNINKNNQQNYEILKLF